MFDPSVDFDDLRWIKESWPGTVVVKGLQTLDDTKRCVELGADGVLLSNHGGRQLDRTPVPFHLLPEAVREVGSDAEVMIDTGIMSGADIVAAVALGARLTLVGRAYLYGLIAGGQAGVARAIRDSLRRDRQDHEAARRSNADELEPAHVTSSLARSRWLAADGGRSSFVRLSRGGRAR